MLNKIFLYSGGAVPLIWGIAHLFPTKSVVQGFGDISLDNKRIITMEWVMEGAALIFIGTILLMITYIDSASTVSKFIYAISFIFLNIFSIISLMTGFKINFVPYKLCPVIFSGSSIMILLGHSL